MKTPIYYLLVILFIGCTTAPKPEKKSVTYQDEKKVELSADLSHISFPIKGMTCEVGCAARIEKKVAASQGVMTSKVDFKSETAYVSFDPSKTSFDAIRSIIEGLGTDYTVGDAKADSPYFAEMNEGKRCKKDCDKPCCKDKKTCDKSCDKPCCKDSIKDTDKKACPADCKKACCAKKEEIA